ncbi:uncharacterized protein BJ212DRAFT_1297702 [Suillus subaureus]|uniref:Uncharacterized protein n=1 Tax=Suillus subaureus TaxID=48587 RepID=A0A9P7EF93_9AGAM|nr:uncharacterized protein BJ212DRAFT_1297702 [Suillus subaureus]KAG1820257.1 hypothetical protein BJ212DRAFT_1297702 [Suillus subaureus]
MSPNYLLNFSPLQNNSVNARTRTHNQIIVIGMKYLGWLLATKSPCFIFYVERSILLELESTCTSCRGKQVKTLLVCLGPARAQITPDPGESSYDSCKHFLLGSELYLWSGPFGDQLGSELESGWTQRLIEDETPCSSLFLEPLIFGLPHLETITQQKFFATDMTMEADWVTLLALEVTSTITMPHGREQTFVEHENEQIIELLDFE